MDSRELCFQRCSRAVTVMPMQYGAEGVRFVQACLLSGKAEMTGWNYKNILKNAAEDGIIRSNETRLPVPI